MLKKRKKKDSSIDWNILKETDIINLNLISIPVWTLCKNNKNKIHYIIL